MGALSEQDIFSKMADGFSEAASLCEKIAATPLRGASYQRLIVVCDEIEGACRQAGHWRENYHWFGLGREVHELQAKMGDWLRDTVSRDEKAKAKSLFQLAAKTMRRLQNLALLKKNQRHGRIGAILPVAAEDRSRQRAVQVPRVTPGGIFVPDGVTIQ